MATAVRGVQGFRAYLEMIKFEHTVFALPFAMLGMMWAAGGWPGAAKLGWILLAMVSARSSAMAFNRIADRRLDALNPRTSSRALPAGVLRLDQALVYFTVSVGLFVLAAGMLNSLSLLLSPVALAVILTYSLSKRFTALCHWWMGLSLGIAPAAAWIAVTGALHPAALLLTAAVAFWTAGFDVIYALQDVDFDRAHGLRSAPETLGPRGALLASRTSHVLAIAFLAAAGAVYGAGPAFFVGVSLAGGLLAYEQSLVSPHDLSRVNIAFFTLNGFVSVSVFAFALLDQVLRAQ